MIKFRRLNIITSVLIIILFSFLFLFCGCAKEYVGKRVNTSEWIIYSPGQKRNFFTGHFVFEIKITETGSDGEYFLEGTLDGTRGSLKSFNHLVIHECRFYILLAKDNVIVDNISFFPKGSDHRNKLPFSRKFKTTYFDSYTIGYEVSVRG